jgi:hypothetical protein
LKNQIGPEFKAARFYMLFSNMVRMGRLLEPGSNVQEQINDRNCPPGQHRTRLTALLLVNTLFDFSERVIFLKQKANCLIYYTINNILVPQILPVFKPHNG